MYAMFWGASDFNQFIGKWNVSNVLNMHWMFNEATSFNQDLTEWCVTNVNINFGLGKTEPDDFSKNSPLLETNKPVWGTCPKTSIIIDKGVYTVSYNEAYEQPNWVKYTVNNRPKNVDRGGMDFYKENGVLTSDDDDYYNNPWDKGHLAPAAAFSDTYDNLYSTFSFLNCAMQIDNLNRGEWRELEQQVRGWSVNSSIDVEIELVFGDEVRSTGVRLPIGFWKRLTFSDGSKKCFYFPNTNTDRNWDQYQVNCN